MLDSEKTKTKTKPPSSHHRSFSQDQLHSVIPNSSTSSPLSGAGRMGDGGLWSIHNSPSLLLLLTLFPSFSMGPLLRLQFLQVISACSDMGSSMGCSVDTCSIMVSSMGCREIPTPQWSLHRLQGILYCSTWSTSSPSSFSDLGACRTVSHTFLSSLLSAVQRLELTVSSMRQPWPLLIEATPAALCCQNFALDIQ